MRVLFLCKTPYQVMTATRLVMSKYEDDIVDIVLFDTIAEVDVLAEGVRESKLYENIYISRTKKYITQNYIMRKLRPITTRLKNLPSNIYHVIYFANVYDWVENKIIKKIRKQGKNNGVDLSVYMFEDGFASYSNHYGDFFEKIEKSKYLDKIIHKYHYSEYYKISGLYLYTPDLIEWSSKFPVYELSKISPSDLTFIKIINTIFGYETMKDEYDKKVIFFEESYFADGKNIDDLEIVNKIVTSIGRDNIIVKIHPRNPANRFKGTGIQTNMNTEIPWEVIALNKDLKNKYLITIASGSALTSLANTSIAPKKIIMLFNCKEINENDLTPSMSMIRKVTQYYPDEVYLPNSYDQFEGYMSLLE